MLTSDLLQAFVRKHLVVPQYIDAEAEELYQLADLLIQTFVEHVGSPQRELAEQLKVIAGDGTEFLLHRGLAKLLTDRCEFEAESPIEPAELRRQVFAQSAKLWQEPGKEWDREETLNRFRQSLDPPLETPTEELERALYADLKEEQILKKFRPVKPKWLLDRYNVALAQGVLFKATDLEIQIGPQPVELFRALFFKMKFFQLMYRVQGRSDSGYTIHLDGPLSLFRSSQKYGLQMASFLPALLHCEDWELKANVLWGKKRTPKQFELTSADGLTSHTRLSGQWQPEEMRFLPVQFAKQNTEWQLSQEAELLDLGGEGVLVPDYVFEHPDGRKAYLEIFGFWRKGAIHSRLELLRKHGPPNLILAVSKELSVDEHDLEGLNAEIYVFRVTPLAGDLVKLLDAMS